MNTGNGDLCSTLSDLSSSSAVGWGKPVGVVIDELPSSTGGEGARRFVFFPSMV